VGALGAGLSGFAAVIEESPRGGAYVRVPPHVIEALGGGGRIPVRFRGSGLLPSPGHALHVAEAQKPETRERRARKTVEDFIR